MQDECPALCKELGLAPRACISYSQLKRIIAQIDDAMFNKINEHFWGARIEQEQQEWYAIDGKELCGSIDGVAGEKRGQNVVSRTSHLQRESLIVDFYNGNKESEKVLVQRYFACRERLQGHYTFDALHLSSDLLQSIQAKQGIYLVQVKSNQKHLLEDCMHTAAHLQASYACREVEKGHGPWEVRVGQAYPLNSESLQSRWVGSGIQTLIVIERTRTQVKIGKSSKEISYWISNKPLDADSFQELFRAVRGHWQVEVHHLYRDKQIGEDALITRNQNESRFMATCITMVINMLHHQKPKNMTQLREQYAYRNKNVYELFNKVTFL
jgi:predicted transposase YbfD/YdcC